MSTRQGDPRVADPDGEAFDRILFEITTWDYAAAERVFREYVAAARREETP